MIDGIWWLVILIAVVIGLWFFAKSRAPNNLTDSKLKNQKKSKPLNDALQKTAELIHQYFPDYRVKRKGSHLLVSQKNIKIAMITMDKKLAIGQRMLGDVPVINYHHVPSRAQLVNSLQGAE